MNAASVSPKPGAARSRHPFNLRLSERKLLLTAMDLLVVNGALAIMLLARVGFSPELFLLNAQWQWFVFISILWLIISNVLDLYDLARAYDPMRSMWTTGGAAILVSTIFLLIPVLTPVLPSNRSELLIFVVVMVLGVAVWRFLYAKILANPSFKQRGLVIGAGLAGQTLAAALTQDKLGYQRYYDIVGFIDDDETKKNSTIAGLPVIGTQSKLVSLVKQLKPDELIVAITHMDAIGNQLFQAILDCREMGIPVSTMTAVYERLTGRVPVEHAGQSLMVVFPSDEADNTRVYALFQRCIDILFGLSGCAVLLFVIPFVWVANKLVSPGPLFYRQLRVGRGGRPFEIIKLRSMVIDAEKNTGAVWSCTKDTRITPFGSFLRKTRLDELPQFINILRSEMSLIGPRPERPEFIVSLSQQIPYYRVRHAVKPGLTGWAQVKYRYGASVEDTLVKLQYDLYYIKHRSVYLDLLIILKTIQVLLAFKGR